MSDVTDVSLTPFRSKKKVKVSPRKVREHYGGFQGVQACQKMDIYHRVVYPTVLQNLRCDQYA